ncbi:ATP-binding protein [Algoriphagus sp. AGSA1]|uniref:hybrid sensor histidine kinase/response regulator n=1 Tax=Algoriphagus sp. AGSA1 TaxID=2907213 RepID=UPI001F32432E|nr:hybrid sensor histidine kinase/response regulator [Algoriphagus sp. AGSA1]MCE7053550.1 ATP-binding protein [Algoriphagus sp. AGSA1]
MQEKGINSTFKKLIYESAEMVFLTDDSYPYSIFYSNQSFEDHIGGSLDDRSLVGMGMEISDFIFSEEVRFSYAGNEFDFQIELPQDSSVNYFLFYKGEKVRNHGLPTKRELELFLMESAEAQFVLKPEGEVFFVNKEALKLFGVSNKERFSHFREIEPYFEDSKQWGFWINEAIANPVPHRFSSILRLSPDLHLELEVVAKQVKLDSNQYIIFSLKNIPEKTTLEKKLVDSSQFLMNLTEQVPGGLYQLVLDSKGEMSFSFLSKGIALVLGLSPEEMENITDISTAMSRIHPLDLPQVVTSSIASAKKQEPWQCQFRVKPDPDKDEYRWLLGTARPQTLNNGDMVWYGYLTDISRQKEFEASLDESRKAAERTNQIKSDFLSMISHELRTPLNAISGSTYTLLNDHPQVHQKSELDTINFAVDNLIIMINDLLDFQKIEAGKLTIEKSPLQLKSFIKQLLKGLSFHASDSNNKLEASLSDGLDITVLGDKTRLSQILNNLITNALKFTKDGEVKVTVNLLEKVNGRVRVYFEVSDNGIGIAPEHQEKIFRDFDQIKPTFSSKYGGTGLGLSITKKLLNLMGGNIELESTLNVGSRFFFDLEFEVAEDQRGSSGNEVEYPDAVLPLNLLMAEDNDVNALVLGKIISKWGFTFERARNGAEAVAAAKKSSFDCILMDLQMPEMNGFDATLAIKQVSDVPVIALSAVARLEVKDRIEDCGFDGFVSKPIDANELRKMILEIILERNHSS